ncbi:[FeFe] hydrogenase H-cluster maturation GTPase HydF [Acutalibacter sp. 1XD8-36]|uniref:[FeFe] hydrogenase H-cluster maturation GTPase HydF n=1 Tax=Acutalibacter sp. 1XD8-36 TaxID=2320852 RepID=UPI0014132353|nr:[FeFe] hydrogenase H-cluster maturation GTPase HydF [Acutalibacter sp. 1XD8-36]NBJ88070.1 [FeFe] hydrogenase H-cluster maturation GTPase HydF [Acutalibacter sp. 1XD8-36]
MSLNETVSAERPHIAFFGMRNAGKSSLVNAVTGQQLAVVSDVKGTTTDPVQKAMELLPIGPVVIIDTPGLDDEGELGKLRVERARQILAKTDIAVLVVDALQGLSGLDKELLKLFKERGLPYCVAYNKADLLPEHTQLGEDSLYVSAKTGDGVTALKEKLGTFAGKTGNERRIVADLLSPGDLAVLVTPIDAAAPKGRLILPQQQTMRDILDAHCAFVTCQTEELAATLGMLAKRPKIVITDSQAFQKVAKVTPKDILLTSFSILFARYKGSLPMLVQCAVQLSHLKDNDPVLISEGCTHHRQCGDIGTVKLPGWIENFTGVKPDYTFTSGGEFPENPDGYKLIVHCGGCMLNETEMKSRVARAKKAGVPIVNYGVAIAHMHGILHRSLEAFPDILELLDK